jgi:hypothetical protein
MSEITGATPSTTRPTRKARVTTPKAAQPAVAASVEQPATVAETPTATAPRPADNKVRSTMVLEYVGDTKAYAKFTPAKGSGCVGTFYAPLGTTEVKVLLVSDGETRQA